jgi:hypothetical protein
MDHKTLVNRFTKACCRFEAIQEDIDILLCDTDNEIKYYEYEGLASQAAEIVLKLSANGKNVGMNFYNYYLCRLEYIIAYFRELLDDEETPLAEDEQDELDDKKVRYYRRIGEFFAAPAEIRFEVDPAGCAFPKTPTFYINNRGIQLPLPAKDEENAATDEAGAVEEDDSEDEQSDEVDNENDAPLDRKAKQGLEEYKGWFELSENERQRVLDTLAVYMGLPSAIHEFMCAPKRLQTNIFLHEVKRHFDLLSGYKNFAEPGSIRYHEGVLRGRIWKVINGVENFRDSRMYDALVKLYPTYKEELQ